MNKRHTNQQQFQPRKTFGAGFVMKKRNRGEQVENDQFNLPVANDV
jgi:hypothetical protein